MGTPCQVYLHMSMYENIEDLPTGGSNHSRYPRKVARASNKSRPFGRDIQTELPLNILYIVLALYSQQTLRTSASPRGTWLFPDRLKQTGTSTFPVMRKRTVSRWINEKGRKKRSKERKKEGKRTGVGGGDRAGWAEGGVYFLHCKTLRSGCVSCFNV